MYEEDAARLRKWFLWQQEREVTLGRKMTDDEWATLVFEPWQRGTEPPPVWLEAVQRGLAQAKAGEFVEAPKIDDTGPSDSS